MQLEVLDFGGTGRPIVLLAGLGNTAHVFDQFAVKLTSLGHVRDHAPGVRRASSRPESGYDVVRLGEDVRAVLEALRIERAVLVGHSIAGQEMSYLAAQHRRTIAALIYLEAAYRYAYDAWRVREGFPEPATSANDSTGRRSTFIHLAGG